MIDHHPAAELLLDFATGAQPQALALAVAGHLEFCSACRNVVADLEAVGGALLETLPPAAISEGALDACLSRLDEQSAGRAPQCPCAPVRGRVPATLRPYLSGRLKALPWQSVGGFFDEVRLPPISSGYRVSLLRVAPTKHVPEHAHEGNEYMLVLAGGYTSGGRHYAVGDFSECAGDEAHTPVADAGEDCVCLLVLDAPLAFRDADGQRIGPLLAM